MVTPTQKALVQASWQQLAPGALNVAELFYDRLFELDPSLEDAFPAHPAEQGTELIRALGVLVRSLDDLDLAIPAVEALGRRHADYGVRTGQYATMGTALLWTLEQSLTEEFSLRTKEAWSAVYELFSHLMIEAASAYAASAQPGSARRNPVGVAASSARQAG